MGCGSSSLKGDNPQSVGGIAEDTRPARQVNTNFATPDYDGDVQKQRRMTEYAPHETERPKPEVSEDVDPVPATDSTLKPYETIDAADQSYPHERAAGAGSNANATPEINGDPTTQSAKDAFASSNEPINNASDNLGDQSESATGGDGKKRSWIGQKYKDYEDSKSGRPSQGQSKFTDEELKKYTGKDNSEMQRMVSEGKGVGAGQSASMRDNPGVGTGMGFGMG